MVGRSQVPAGDTVTTGYNLNSITSEKLTELHFLLPTNPKVSKLDIREIYNICSVQCTPLCKTAFSWCLFLLYSDLCEVLHLVKFVKDVPQQN